MDKRIARMRDHIVLCGAGRTGVEIAQELYKTLTPFVIIEKDEEALQRLPFLREVAYLQGDATRDSVLRRSRIERAKGLLAVLPNDQANVFLVLIPTNQFRLKTPWEARRPSQINKTPAATNSPAKKTAAAHGIGSPASPLLNIVLPTPPGNQHRASG